MSIFQIESYKKGIIYSSFLSVFSKILGFGNNLILAYCFGTHAKMDIYFYTVATFSLLASFLTTMDSSVLIAQSMRIRERKGTEESMKFLNFFLYCFLLIVIIVTIIIALNPITFLQHFSKFQFSILNDNYYVILLSLPLFFLIVITTFLTDVLYSYKFFTLPVIASIVNTCIIIMFVISFQSRLDILSVVLGSIFSYLFNLGLLVYLLVKELKWDFRFKMVQIDKVVWKNLFYSQAGNVFTILASYLPLYLLSNFNSGIISGLNYGKKIADLPILFITSQLTLVVGVKFNELYAKDELSSLNSVFTSTVKLLIFLLAIISGILFINGEEIIITFFFRGEFDMQSVEISTNFLIYFGFALPFLAIISLIGNLFIAAQIIRYSFFYQILVNSVQLGILFFGVKSFDYIGYPLAVLLTNVLNVFCVYFLFKKLFPYINYLDILRYLILVICLNIIIILIIKLLPFSYFSSILKLVISSILYFGLILGLNLKFHFNKELNDFIYHVVKIKFFKSE